MEGDQDNATPEQQSDTSASPVGESESTPAASGAATGTETTADATPAGDGGAPSMPELPGFSATETENLAGIGYGPEDVQAAIDLLGADKAAQKFRALTTQAYARFRELGKNQHAPDKGAQPQGGAPATTPKPGATDRQVAAADKALDKAAAGGFLTEAQTKAIADAYGQELVDGLIKPMQAAIEAQTKGMSDQLAQMQQELTAIKLQPALDGFQKAIEPLQQANPQLLAMIGPSWDQANEQQFNLRTELADRAYAIREDQARRGIRISPATALSLAVSAHLGAPVTPAAAVQRVEQQVKARAANRSIAPSAGRTSAAANANPADPYAPAKQAARDWFKKNSG